MNFGVFRSTSRMAVRTDPVKSAEKVGSISIGNTFAVSNRKTNDDGSEWGYVDSRKGWVCLRTLMSERAREL